MSYKIGSFNCLNFGRADKDVETFANIIQNEKFDIIALQEIRGQKALDRILYHLRTTHWTGVADNDVNDYAFIWNTTRIALAEEGLSDKNSKRIYKPRIYKQYHIDRKNGQKDLLREPFYARFIPIGGAAPFIEIRLINTHIRFSKGSSGNEIGDSQGAIKMRKNEFDVLTKAIYSKEADKRYGNNRPAYTILLGDYNLNLPSAGAPYLTESFEINESHPTKIITTFQDQLTTLKDPDTSHDNSESGFSNNFDHFTYDVNRFEDTTVNCNEINAVQRYYHNDFVKYKENVSDHIPVVMDFDIRR